MEKANFKGYDAGLPSPSLKQGAPNSSITQAFKDGKGPSSYSPLVGCGSDSRPHVDDDRIGANRWKMGENKPTDIQKIEVSYK